MMNATTATRLLGILLALGLAWVPSWLVTESIGGGPEVDIVQRAQVLNSTNAFYTPPTVPRDDKKKLVDAQLTVAMTDHLIESKTSTLEKQIVQLRSYNNKIVGPTIRVRPGDTLKIKLDNKIPLAEKEALFGKGHNRPNGANITNLHPHGLKVSPRRPADDVFIEVGPQQSFAYEFKIPEDHPAGTFWYHPHRHGSAAFQLCSGLAGALIVDPGAAGGLDDVPEIKAAMQDGREKILVFQDLTYSRTLAEKKKAVVREHDAYTIDPRMDGKTQFPRIVINGVLSPVITMKPGEVQRWRCVFAGITQTLKLAIEDRSDPRRRLKLHEIAVDGLPLGTMNEQGFVILQPGNRSDFLVQAPETPGEYLLLTTSVEQIDNNRSLDQTKNVYLARVKIEGPKTPMKLPDPKALAKYRLPWVQDSEIKVERELVFKGHELMIKGKDIKDPKWVKFDADRVDIRCELGTAEQWVLRSEGDPHPFHIHVNPFEVIAGGKSNTRVWRDTVLVPPGAKNAVTIRMRFERFDGRAVLHCHNLDHEDQGMMMIVDIVKPGQAPAPKKQAGLPNVPMAAPDWKLFDGQGRTHTLSDFAGRDLVLVFSRGPYCSHCMTQLHEFARRHADFAKANTTVVAVCPETPAELRDALASMPLAQRLPFLVLADAEQAAFAKYGCRSDRLLHGVFHIDPSGTVRWQTVGDEDVFLGACRIELGNLGEIKKVGQARSLAGRASDGRDYPSLASPANGSHQIGIDTAL